eukprot:EG_transcript_25654
MEQARTPHHYTSDAPPPPLEVAPPRRAEVHPGYYGVDAAHQIIGHKPYGPPLPPPRVGIHFSPADTPTPEADPTERPWFGVSLAWHDSDFGRSDTGIVNRVHEDSPAHKAGILVGDHLEYWDYIHLTSAEELLQRIKAMKVGDVVSIGVRRNNTDFHFPVRIEATPLAILAGSRNAMGGLP